MSPIITFLYRIGTIEEPQLLLPYQTKIQKNIVDSMESCCEIKVYKNREGQTVVNKCLHLTQFPNWLDTNIRSVKTEAEFCSLF